MMRMIGSALAVMAFAGSAWASPIQDGVFFSFSPTDPTAVIQPAWHEITGSAANRTLYVWVSTPTTGTNDITPPDQGLTPTNIQGIVIDVPNSSAGIDLNVTDTNTISSFTAAQVFNNTFTYNGSGANPVTGIDVNGVNRANVWDVASNYTLAGNPSNVSATSITDLNAAVVPTTFNTTLADTTSNGANPTDVARGFAITQTAAGVSSGPTKVAVISTTDFLLGEIQFTTTAYGSDTIQIAAGSSGITKGNTNLTSTYSYGNETIQVTPAPEPVCLGWITFAGLALLSRRS